MLQHPSDCNWITEPEFDFTQVPYSITLVKYELPKVHKYHNNPPFRPIVSGNSSITEPLSKFVINKQPSGLKENFWSSCHVETNVLSARLDGESRFTFTPPAGSLETISRANTDTDVTVFKGDVNTIHAFIYHKPTDHDTLLPATSNDPKHTNNSVPTGQVLRLH